MSKEFTVTEDTVFELYSEFVEIEYGLIALWNALFENRKMQTDEALSGCVVLLSMLNDRLGVTIQRLDPHGERSVLRSAPRFQEVRRA